MEEAMTFHSWEQNELEDVIKNTKLEVGWPNENHPPILWHMKIKLKTLWELIWDLAKNQVF
jgi:hypothetical protein